MGTFFLAGALSHRGDATKAERQKGSRSTLCASASLRLCGKFLFTAIFLSKTLPAQVATQNTLPGVSIYSARAQATGTGLRTEAADSVLRQHNIAGSLTDLLGSGMLYLKNYNPGGLATMAVRGANAEQTAVMWNGVNIQASTHGEADLSLLPVFLFDNISFQPGSSSAGWGSGAIGGALFLGNNNVRYLNNASTRNVQLINRWGSFGDNFEGVAFSGYGSGYRAISVRLFRRQAVNNFPFSNTTLPGAPVMNQQHGGFFSQGGMVDVPLFERMRNTITLHTWVQETSRDLPPTMLEGESKAWQRDYSLRNVLDWNFNPASETWNLKTKFAFFHEGLLFFDGYTQPASNTDAWTGIAESEWTLTKFKKWKISAGVNDTWNEAQVTKYMPATQQNRASVFASAKYFASGKLQTAFALREEELNGRILFPVGELGADYALLNWLTLRANAARNYRIPTFNDLYWQPGGNPNLRPEQSWGEEGTIDLHFKKLFWGHVAPPQKSLAFSYRLTVYNRNVTDWLIWLPGPLYWAPQNILSVWSRGTENRVSIEVKIKKWTCSLTGAYDYTRATNEKVVNAADSSLHKQLIYVPQQRMSGMALVSYSGWYVTYQQQFTDLVFTSADHTSWLPSYSVANMQVGKNIVHAGSGRTWNSNRTITCDFYFAVNNVWNTAYQVVAWRPMPGRNFMFGISLKYDRKVTYLDKDDAS